MGYIINNKLEQQAKAIFKSWFVDFEPFGSEQPSEMQFVPLQDICKVVTKGTTPTTLGKSFTTSGINFIKAESILDNHSIDNTKFAYIDDETNIVYVHIDDSKTQKLIHGKYVQQIILHYDFENGNPPKEFRRAQGFVIFNEKIRDYE